MSRRRKAAAHVNHERWMVSFADFMTLLFALFVVLFAISSVDQDKLKVVSESMESAFGVMDSSGSTILNGSPEKSSVVAPVVTEINVSPLTKEQKKMLKRLEKMAEGNQNLAAAFNLRQEARGIVIQLQDTRLFASGSAELRAGVLPELKKVVQEVAGLKQPVRIEGHTDNVPVNGGRYASNWDLSAARANQVLRFFLSQSQMPPADFSVAGYGEFRPIAPNSTEQGRAKNRRVDIVILNAQASKNEPLVPNRPEGNLEDSLNQKLNQRR